MIKYTGAALLGISVHQATKLNLMIKEPNLNVNVLDPLEIKQEIVAKDSENAQDG